MHINLDSLEVYFLTGEAHLVSEWSIKLGDKIFI